MKNYKPITIGVLNHNNKIFNDFFNKSVNKIKGNHEVIIKQNLRPATAFNQIIKESKYNYILLTHADVLFDDDFIKSVQKSILTLPNFGAMGVVGVKKPFLRKKKYIKACSFKNEQVTTLDSCCILINKKHNLKFDDLNFNEYHHFVEDFLRVLSGDTTFSLEAENSDAAALFSTSDGFSYVVMPLARDQ